MDSFDVQSVLSDAKEGKLLSESTLFTLCELAKEVLVEEGNVVDVPAPAIVVGDVHGQFHDVLEMFRTAGDAETNRYVFLGDYVDRGANSLETFVLLLALKLRYGEQVTLLRGNHESRQITQAYGFYDEIVAKYGSSRIWHTCCDVFDCLPLSAVIGGSVVCVHGGLSPEAATVDQIRLIHRMQELPNEGPLCDLMWSDPSEATSTWTLGPRGVGWLFGQKVASHFLHHNNLTTLCRAHQLANEGYQKVFGGQVVTVWSAPNYCYRCGNKACVMRFDEHMNSEFIFFEEASSKAGITENEKPRADLYFL